jgi:hypothetical protein
VSGDVYVSGRIRLVAALQAIPERRSVNVIRNNFDVRFENIGKIPFGSTFPFYSFAGNLSVREF